MSSSLRLPDATNSPPRRNSAPHEEKPTRGGRVSCPGGRRESRATSTAATGHAPRRRDLIFGARQMKAADKETKNRSNKLARISTPPRSLHPNAPRDSPKNSGSKEEERGGRRRRRNPAAVLLPVRKPPRDASAYRAPSRKSQSLPQQTAGAPRRLLSPGRKRKEKRKSPRSPGIQNVPRARGKWPEELRAGESNIKERLLQRGRTTGSPPEIKVAAADRQGIPGYPRQELTSPASWGVSLGC